MSLDHSYDPENIFAKIIRGDIPCVKLVETSTVLSFMDVFPQSKGHCLVIHKNSTAVNLLDVEEGALKEMISITQQVARAVKTALEPDGIRIMQFNGAPAGQTIFHLHFHVLPIYETAPSTPHASGAPTSPEELEPIASKIRNALPRT